MGLGDNHLRIMFLSTLPSALEDEIAMKHDLGKTLADAVEYVEARTNRSRERELIERLAKSRKAGLGINAITTNQSPTSAPDLSQYPDLETNW